MRSARKRISIALVLTVGLAVLSWLGLERIGGDPERVDPVRAAEIALSVPDLVLLGQADLVQLAALSATAGAGSPPGLRDWLTWIVDMVELEELMSVPGLSSGARYALLAVAGSGTPPRTSAVILGSFEPTTVVSQLMASLPGSPRVAERGDERVVHFERVDEETCARTPWGLAVGPQRVVIHSGGPIDELLAKLERAEESMVEPSGLLDTSGPPLLGASVHPAGLSGWKAALPRVLGGAALDGWQSVALRVDGPDVLGRLDFALEARVQGDSEREAARWAELGKSLPAETLALWQELVPHLARWYTELDVASSGATVRLDGTRKSESVAGLGTLAYEVLTLAAGVPMANDPAAENGVAAVEPWPTRFRVQQGLAELKGYGHQRGLREPADQTAGPFGFRVERVSRASHLDPIEIEIRALGPVISNLREPLDSPRMFVSRIVDTDGRDLQQPAICGPSRPDAPVVLERDGVLAERTVASKHSFLRPDARVADVARIEGHVEFRLPVTTARVVELEPESGGIVEREAARLQLIAVHDRSFAYRVLEGSSLIAIRGLNEERLPLEAVAAWDLEDARLGAPMGARHYKSPLAYIEAIFAKQTRDARYDFALASGLPGTEGEALDVQSSLYIQYSPEQYEREFGVVDTARWELEGEPLTETSTGAFRIALRSLEPRDASSAAVAAEQGSVPLAPRLELLAPDIPNLSYNVTGLELSLATDPPSTEPWRTLVWPRYRFGKRSLQADLELERVKAPSGAALAALDALAALEGELRLRLPGGVSTVAFDAVEPGESVRAPDVECTLQELGRDRFALRMRGPIERFFSARAFSSDGRELAVRPLDAPLLPEERMLRFRVWGRPARIELQLAEDVTTLRFPLRLELASH